MKVIFTGQLLLDKNFAVNEAESKLGQRKAEYDQKTLDIQYEGQVAWEQLNESRRTVLLYE